MTDEIISKVGEGAGLSRRTVMKGAAWSVPVVMVATAAPAMASSPGFVDFLGTACKYPGNSNKDYPKAYKFDMVSNNSQPFPVLIVVKAFSVSGANLQGKQYLDIVPAQGSTTCAPTCTPDLTGAMEDLGQLPAVLCVPANGTVYWQAITGRFGDSANSQVTITFDVYRADGAGACVPVVTADTSSSSPATPPCADILPTLTAVDPTSGSAAGSTLVTITGTNFSGWDTVSVFFGAAGDAAAAATSVTVVNGTTITCVSPARPAGVYPITVLVQTNEGFSYSVSLPNAYTFS